MDRKLAKKLSENLRRGQTPSERDRRDRDREREKEKERKKKHQKDKGKKGSKGSSESLLHRSSSRSKDRDRDRDRERSSGKGPSSASYSSSKKKSDKDKGRSGSSSRDHKREQEDDEDEDEDIPNVVLENDSPENSSSLTKVESEGDIVEEEEDENDNATRRKKSSSSRSNCNRMGAFLPGLSSSSSLGYSRRRSDPDPVGEEEEPGFEEDPIQEDEPRSSSSRGNRRSSSSKKASYQPDDEDEGNVYAEEESPHIEDDDEEEFPIMKKKSSPNRGSSPSSSSSSRQLLTRQSLVVQEENNYGPQDERLVGLGARSSAPRSRIRLCPSEVMRDTLLSSRNRSRVQLQMALAPLPLSNSCEQGSLCSLLDSREDYRYPTGTSGGERSRHSLRDANFNDIGYTQGTSRLRGRDFNHNQREVTALPIEIPETVTDEAAFRRYLSKSSYESVGDGGPAPLPHAMAAGATSRSGTSLAAKLDANRKTNCLCFAIVSLALLCASASQLRFVVAYSKAHSYPALNYFCISISIIIEIIVGVGFVVLSRLPLKESRKDNIVSIFIAGLFIVAINNVVIAAIAFDDHVCEVLAKQTQELDIIDQGQGAQNPNANTNNNNNDVQDQ